MESATYCLSKEFDIVLSRWKKCHITKHRCHSMSVQALTVDTLKQYSRNLQILSFANILLLQSFLSSIFLPFFISTNIFEHQLCALGTRVMGGSKQDPGLLLIFSKVQQRRQVIKMELQCCVMSMNTQHVQDGKSFGTSLRFRERLLRAPLERLLPPLFYICEISITFQNLREIGLIRTVPHVSAMLAGGYDLNPRS